MINDIHRLKAALAYFYGRAKVLDEMVCDDHGFRPASIFPEWIKHEDAVREFGCAEEPETEALT